MERQHQTSKKRGLFFFKYSDLYLSLLVYLISLLNLFVIFSYSESNGDRIDDPKFPYLLNVIQTRIVIYIMLAVIVFFLFFVLLINMVLYSPVAKFVF